MGKSLKITDKTFNHHQHHQHQHQHLHLRGLVQRGLRLRGLLQHLHQHLHLHLRWMNPLMIVLGAGHKPDLYAKASRHLEYKKHIVGGVVLRGQQCHHLFCNRLRVPRKAVDPFRRTG